MNEIHVNFCFDDDCLYGGDITLDSVSLFSFFFFFLFILFQNTVA